MSSVTFSPSRAIGQPSETVTTKSPLKEKLEEFINSLQLITSVSIEVIYNYNHHFNKNKRYVDREKLLHFHMLDYHISKKFHSITSTNPEILHHEENTKKINDLVDDWLIINAIIWESFQKNYPKEFQENLQGAKMMSGINSSKTFEEIKSTRNLQKKFHSNDYSYKKHLEKKGYNQKQIGELILMEKIENYVTERLEKEESIEDKISYINSYIDCEERKNIREIFFKVAQKYKLFDIKNKKFDYKKIIKFLKKHRKKIIPIGIAISAIGTLAGFFFYNDSNNTNNEEIFWL